MDVSIIIVNYNTKDLTSQCIDSIYEKTQGVRFEIILVDNASTDGSKEVFEKDTRITYIYSDENLGFGRANNLGLSTTQGRNILFLNPDTILINNAIKLLSDYLDEHSCVGACGANLYDIDMGHALSYKRIFPGITSELSNLFFHIPEKIFFGKSWYHNFTSSPISTAYISGADLMIKKSILDKVGPFAPEFFMYYEETDLCFRIHKAGYKLISLPHAKIQHLEGKSFQSTINHKRLQFSENGRAIFYKRNYTEGYQFIANLIYKFSLYFHQLVYTLLGERAKSKACKCKRQFLSEIL